MEIMTGLWVDVNASATHPDRELTAEEHAHLGIEEVAR